MSVSLKRFNDYCLESFSKKLISLTKKFKFENNQEYDNLSNKSGVHNEALDAEYLWDSWIKKNEVKVQYYLLALY